ncbi:MAG: lipopolysaccharide heptosyltransferase II [Nitrospinae bacterium]|nr:lipopolysaccharide heptosyltransferase II [Nitrospinota bacterium]
MKLNLESARRILVRAPNWLGDAIMSLPAIKGLAEIFEPPELAVVAPASLDGLFERYGFINEVHYITKKNSFGAHKALAGKYDAMFLFTNSFRSALHALAAKCPVRVGYGGNFRGPLLTNVMPKLKRVHMVDYYLNLVRPFGVRMFGQNADFPLLPEEAAFAENISGLDDAVAIPLGARYGSAKCWPHRQLKAFIKLAAGDDRRVVLLGTNSDEMQGEALEDVAPTKITNLVGKTTIGQMAAVMARCAWVVANDSGPLHVAGATGVKTIAIFGPTDHSRTAPMADCVRLVTQNSDCAPCFKRECNGDHHCMEEISAEEIYSIMRTDEKN